MKKTRIGIKRRRRKMNGIVAIFFLIILPITAIAIGSRITEWWVVPTMNTDDILKPPGNIALENIEKPNDDNIQTDMDERHEDTQKSELSTQVLDINPLSVYMIQIASISDNKNIEVLIEELSNHGFPNIIYKIDNIYKVYTYGSTKRENIEKELEKVREVYPDAYIGQMHLPKKQIHYSIEENIGTKELVDNVNILIELLNKSSDELYKSANKQGDIKDYKEILNNHKMILEDISEKAKNANLPKDFAKVDDINKMIEYQEKNIAESLKILENENDSYKLQNYFLDSLFRTIELIKK